MEILYISALSSKALVDSIHRQTHENPGFAVQKFSRLIVNGFILNKVKCSTLSSPPISRKFSGKIFSTIPDETEGLIEYKYIPFIDIPVLKHICIVLYTFFKILFWGAKNKLNKVVVCDVLSISASMGAILASKCCGIKSVAVVTDIYDQMVGKKTTGIRGFLSKMAGGLNRIYVKSFSSYVLLTEDMNMLVNPKCKPYIVMEGLCDVDVIADNLPVDKYSHKVVLYAGGLEEQYGVKMLVDAFKSIDTADIELHLYGSGSYVETLVEDMNTDKRIKYFGVCPNEMIVEAEKKATLLVNPRFTHEEFVKYSFPSKNMEYMASGTPLLTTKLPGMPKEYEEYVFLFDEETTKGYAQALNLVLSMPEDALVRKGQAAREFVLREKNHVVQARRIIRLIQNGKSF